MCFGHNISISQSNVTPNIVVKCLVLMFRFLAVQCSNLLGPNTNSPDL